MKKVKFFRGNSQAFNLSLPESLKGMMGEVELPVGVSWSDVFQVLVLGLVAEKYNLSDEKFKAVLYQHPKGKEIREWFREVFPELIAED